MYEHYAFKVLTADGIQDMSNINVSYDPAYQKLSFHTLKIIRNGKEINKLKDIEIEVIRRESNLERSLYDGSLTAVINIPDVRVNDIIEYAYTTTGFNPANEGNFSATYYLQYTLPVNRIYAKIITPKASSLQYKLLDDAPKPKKLATDTGIAYIWDLAAEESAVYDSNTPNWYSKQKRISVSTFKNWKDVNQLMLSIFNKVPKTLGVTDGITDPKASLEENIINAIQFVQDDVRYLGFESGINAFQPHAPKEVLQRRYGDCKDKSLLLVTLLQQMGVTAYPFLVNTYSSKNFEQLLPSHTLFNHCIAYFSLNGKEYFVDPTLNYQGGDLDHIAFPEYGAGLLVKEHEATLKTIPTTEPPTVTIEENITLDSINGSASFTIASVYTGSKADYMRSYLTSTTQENLNSEFLNYYSNLYPNITNVKDVVYEDNHRDNTNSLRITEHYKINPFWNTSEEEGLIYCETSPLILESQIDYASSTKRQMPYYTGTPFKFSQKTIVHLPESWIIKDSDYHQGDDNFTYDRAISYADRTLTISHDYELKKSVLPASEVTSFLKKHSDINDKIAYQLTYNDNTIATNTSASSFSWLSVLLALISLGTAIFFAIKLYKKYDPAPKGNQNLAIGGWLVLPAIGLTLSPIVLLFQIIGLDFFSGNTWEGLLSYEYPTSFYLVIIYGLEIIINMAYLVFVVVVLILFYQKRSNVPILISIVYILAFLVPLIDTLSIDLLIPDLYSSEENNSTYTTILRSFISACIWIPYFNISDRVKNTFTNTYKKEMPKVEEATESNLLHH